MNAPEISVVMPCLNEAETLETCVRKAFAWFELAQVHGEVVVGDNGSSDGSQEIARRCGARVVEVNERGYGAALWHATSAAHGRYIVMGDSDDSYDFANLEPFLAQLRAGVDLVMGNRFRGGIAPGAMPWKNRWIGNPVLTGIGRLLFRCPVRDFHCGIRGFSREAFLRMDLRTTGMEYASEMIIKATVLGLRVREVPTTLAKDGRSRPPHLRPWRDGWRHLRFMLLFSPRWLFWYPSMATMAVGLAGIAWLLPGPRTVGRATFDVHSLLCAGVLVVIGHLGAMLAMAAKAFSAREGLTRLAPSTERGIRLLSFENSLILGLVIGAAGVVGILASVLQWGRVQFGPLDPSATMRALVPSLMALLIGTQTVLGGFLLSVLHLPVRRIRS